MAEFTGEWAALKLEIGKAIQALTAGSTNGPERSVNATAIVLVGGGTPQQILRMEPRSLRPERHWI